MNEENKQGGSLLSGQEPHQKQDMDQAVRSSEAAFELETEKGLSPDPEQYNKGGQTGNIKQVHLDKRAGVQESDQPSDGGADLDQVIENPDLDPGEYDVSSEDLRNLDAMDNLEQEQDFPGHS